MTRVEKMKDLREGYNTRLQIGLAVSLSICYLVLQYTVPYTLKPFQAPYDDTYAVQSSNIELVIETLEAKPAPAKKVISPIIETVEKLPIEKPAEPVKDPQPATTGEPGEGPPQHNGPVGPQVVVPDPVVETKPTPPPVYTFVEQMPYLKGCTDIQDETQRKQCSDTKVLEFVLKNFKMSNTHLDEGSVLVVVSFIIDTNGKVTNPKVVRDPGFGAAKEALRVLKSMPDWEPGKQNGRLVNVQMNLPIRLKVE